MLYRWAADLVVVVHFAFILFVTTGSILAWRWPRLLWLHIPAVVYGIALVTIGFDCPLTTLENSLRRRGGEQAYTGGFVNRYLRDVIYPGRLTGLLRGLVAVCIVVGYAGLLTRRRTERRLTSTA
jgi:hypothetical protein